MGYSGGAVSCKAWTVCVYVCVAALTLTEGRRLRQPRCPVGCTCTKDNALCEDITSVPHTFPTDVVSL